MAEEKVSIIYELVDKTSSKLKNLADKFKFLRSGIDLFGKSGNLLRGGLSKIGSGFAKLGKSVFSLTSLLGAAGLGGSISYATSLFQKQRKVLAQTEAVLKSTGNASGLTAKEVNAMAVSLQKVTNFGDEVTQTGQNILLTFKNIGKDIFPRVTETMLDVSAAMGQDVKSSAIQLGKALNDPATGLTMLTRVGITFTEQQKEQIKTLHQSGDLLSAQTIILNELESQFGGSARAIVDPITQMKNALGDFGEVAGEKLSPIVNLTAEKIKNLAENAQLFLKKFNFIPVLTSASYLLSKIKVIFVDIETNIKIAAENIKEIIKRPFSFSTYKNLLISLSDRIKYVFEFVSKISNFTAEGIAKFRKKLLDAEVGDVETFEQKITRIKKEGELKKQAILLESEKTKEEIVKKSLENQKSINNYALNNFKTTENQKTEKVKEENKKQEIELKNHHKKLTSMGQDFGKDFESGLRKTVGTLIEGENGITQKVSDGLQSVLPGIGALIGGGIGGLIFNLFDNIFGSSGKKRSFQETWKNHLKELRDRTNTILEGIGKKKDPFERQLEILEELKEEIGLQGKIPAQIASSLGVTVDTTVKDAIEQVGDRLRQANETGLDELNADLQSVLSEIENSQKTLDRITTQREEKIRQVMETSRLSRVEAQIVLLKNEEARLLYSRMHRLNTQIKDLQKVAEEKQAALAEDQVIILDQILDNLRTQQQIAELTEEDIPSAIEAVPDDLASQFANSNNQFIPSSSILSTPQQNLISESQGKGTLPNVNVASPATSTNNSNSSLDGTQITLVLADGTNLGKATFKIQQEMLLNGEINPSRT